MFSEILKKLRNKYGMTQKQLADKIGVEKSSIAKYESGKGIMPSDDLKIKIADIFNVSLDYLMGRDTSEDGCYNYHFDDESLQIVLLYQTLNDKGKETAINIMRALSSCEDMSAENGIGKEAV